MPPSPLHLRRTQNTLLFQKLLNLRDGASPFTLILDSLEARGAKLVLEEFMRRAKLSKTKIVFISFRALRKPKLADIFINARKKGLKDLRAEIVSTFISTSAAGARTLLIIDNLNPLCNSSALVLPAFLSSLLGPTVSMLGVYHTDISTTNLTPTTRSYDSHPIMTLTYLATSILTLHSLSQTVAKKAARDRSLQEPSFGLAERREGILVGLSKAKAKSAHQSSTGTDLEEELGVVVEMEIRRKSGRGVRDVFVLIPRVGVSPSPTSPVSGSPVTAKIILLDEHPLYASPEPGSSTQESSETDADVTFSLSLTDKQKRDREGVVLPYFDAQREEFIGSAAEGGRILYDMGREDDFDEEEDEI